MVVTPHRYLYSVGYLLFYDRSTSVPIGGQPCPASASIEASGGLEVLKCLGAQVASEPQSIERTLSGSIKFLDDFILTTLTGAPAVVNAAEAVGSVQAIADYFGTSVVDATTGIASVAVDTPTQTAVKTQKYILRAASATTVDVYVSSAIQGEVLLDDFHKIDTITIPGASATVVIPNTGVVITGGSGAIAMTVGDTAVFTTRHFNNAGSSIITFGANQLTAFGAIIAVSNSRGDQTYFDLPNVVPSGAFSIALEEDAFSINDFEAGVNIDPIKGYAMQMVHVRGAGS